MDKFAVVLDEEHLKTAMSGSGSCPSCGSRKVDNRGLTPLCPNCGTEPWEKHASSKEVSPRRKW
jgi:predicted RNA-binding Zn-ribbon protein involved in translation (DUF1610 family)